MPGMSGACYRLWLRAQVLSSFESLVYVARATLHDWQIYNRHDTDGLERPRSVRLESAGFIVRPIILFIVGN